MDLHDDWYLFDQAEKIDSPALLFYSDRVEENIRTAIYIVNDPARLRPHIKTCKAKEPVLLMMNAGIQKFKCATVAEAEMLAICEAPDVLLAYQPTEFKLLRLINLIKNYSETKFSCLVDNFKSAKLFSDTCLSNNISLPVYIDLNVGMNRTGISPGVAAIDLFEAIIKLPNLIVQGLHAYDGHIRSVNFQKRTQLCDDCFKPVEKIRQIIKDKGYANPLLIAGGSPTFQIHLKRQNTEVSPGTFIFWDNGYKDNIPEQNFLPSALVMTRIISLPDENKICIDLGYKSISSENDLQHRVYFLNASHLKPLSHSEEHMVLDAGAGHSFKIGDTFYALPVHICPTVALYNYGICIRSGKIERKWEIIAGNREINY